MQNIKLLVIGDGVFFDKKDSLVLKGYNDNIKGYIHENNDVFFGKKEEVETGVSTNKEIVYFDAYNGYPVSNEFGKALGLKRILVLSDGLDHSVLLENRGKTLCVDDVCLGVSNKLDTLNQLCYNYSINQNEVCYVDNNLDISNPLEREIIENVGLVVCSESKKQEYLNQGFNDNKIHTFSSNSTRPLRDFSEGPLIQSMEKVQELYNKTRVGQIDDISTEENLTKALFIDIDGTLTNNRKYYDDSGNEFKRFSPIDMSALKQSYENGYKLVFATGDKTQIPENFTKHVFGFDVVAQRVDEFLNNSLEQNNEPLLVIGSSSKKVAIVNYVCEELNYTLSECAYMGDERNDLGVHEHVLKGAGVTFAPINSINVIKDIEGVQVLSATGGNGAVAGSINMINERNRRMIIESERTKNQNNELFTKPQAGSSTSVLADNDFSLNMNKQNFSQTKIHQKYINQSCDNSISMQ